MTQEMTLTPTQIERLKRQVWYKFIVNVSLEEYPIQALEEAGYDPISAHHITGIAKHYKATGNVI